MLPIPRNLHITILFIVELSGSLSCFISKKNRKSRFKVNITGVPISLSRVILDLSFNKTAHPCIINRNRVEKQKVHAG